MKRDVYIKPSIEIIRMSTENLLHTVSGNVKDYGDGGDLGSDSDGAKANGITDFNNEDDEKN